MSDERQPQNGGELGASEKKHTKNKKSTKERVKKGVDTAKKLIKKGAGKSSLLAALAPILMGIFVAIIFLIIIIGLVMFFITMPGMVMEQIKALFSALGDYVAAFFGADTTEQIEEEDIYDTLDYLHQMGYDLKGYGFLTDYMTEADIDDSSKEQLDEEVGVIRSKEDDTIVKAASDFIQMYIVSDNYVYTLKNDNLNTQQSADNWFESIGAGILTAWYKIENFFFGPVFDFLGVTDAAGETWGKGLIAVYYDTGEIGVKKNLVNQGSFWNWDGIKINTDNKTLSIEKNSFFNLNNPIEYKLDGWTGRYGMPVEFLLSVHIATMMPDLAFDMATSFPTEVKLYLHDIDTGEAVSAYKSESQNKYITYEELNTALTGVAGRNLFSAVWSWFDNLGQDDQEVQIASKLGIDHAADCECTKSEVEGYQYNGNVVFKDDTGYYYTTKDAAGNDVRNDVAESDVTVTKSEEYSTVCSQCKAYLSKVISTLRGGNDYDFDCYVPYIASVDNHWYRDVRFVVDQNETGVDFVDWDYEYEAMMKERWTLYQTYSFEENPDKAGEYKLYRLDNGQLWDKTAEEAAKEGIIVVKKAEVIKSTDTDALTDMSWNNNSGSIWTAYDEIDDETETGYERIYTDDEIAELSEPEKTVKSKLYINLKTSGNIEQTGEGQRLETNPTIKKMFLENNYFRYDGKPESAEIVTALRKNVASGKGEETYYGKLESGDLSTTASVTIDGKSDTYKAEDYSGKVSLNQDSLNAFSMLENTHTLDADYIYRDFKELIVELGYFTKEELTDETPKLLQWIVPDIGSGGFPRRNIDKREQEYGTMVHSKGDLEANMKNTIAAAIAMASEESSTDESKTPGATSMIDGSKNERFEDAVTNLVGNKDRNQYISLGAGAGTGSTGSSSSSSLLSLDAWWEETQKIFDVYKNESWVYSDHGMGQSQGCNAGTTFETHGHNDTDCSIGASWMLQKLGALKDNHTFTSYLGDSGSLDESNVCAQDMMDAGAEVILPPDGTKFTAAANGGELEPGDVLFYDGHVSIYCGDSYDSGGTLFCWDTGSTTGIQGGGPRETSWEDRDIELIVRFPLGNKAASGDSYKGYEGNEAVVSPVTGILLEYNTYTETDKDSITNEEYRVNADLKHGINNPSVLIKDDETENPEQPAANPEPNPGPNSGPDTGTKNQEIVHDKVGYAKILVLDAENYQLLESNTSNRWQNDSLVRIKPGKPTTSESEVSYDTNKAKVNFIERLSSAEQMDEEHENWNLLDKTVYGYKEFVEAYEKYGIAGNIVYIDGFVCEKPEEALDGGDSDDSDDSDKTSSVAETLPDGEDLTMESFMKITQDNLMTTEPPEDDDNTMPSKYLADPEYKMASKKATDKLNGESAVKNEAYSTITVNEVEYPFIKEGTVIGRTMTDKELIEKVRKEKDKPYEYYRPEDEVVDPNNPDADKEDNNDKVMGNYIRIIMRDLDDTVVENVEEYMKIDDLMGETQAGDQEYQFQEGDLDLLADAIHHEGCGSYDDPSGSDEDQLYLAKSVGFTIINKLNSDSGYNHAAGWGWAPDKSQLYNLLCVVPCAAHGGNGWYAISDDGTLGGLKNRADQNKYEYCDMCMEAAEYIKENDSMNFLNNGKYGSQYSAGEGMPHTCWEQGGNYSAGRKWAEFRSNYLFDPSDK